LLFDIIGSDGAVFKTQPNCCKKFVLESPVLIQRLFEFLEVASVNDRMVLDVREFTLMIFEYLVSYDKTLLKAGLQEVLSKLSRALIGANADQDLRELLQKEQQLIIAVI